MKSFWCAPAEPLLPQTTGKEEAEEEQVLCSIYTFWRTKLGTGFFSRARLALGSPPQDILLSLPPSRSVHTLVSKTSVLAFSSGISL